MYIDELTLWDGIFEEKPAACCKADLTCVIASQADCSAMSGVFHAGDACDPSPCCPAAWPDGDHDGDVDMIDFANMQRCINVGLPGSGYADGCGCFDKNKDGSINITDVEKFALCAQGEGIIVESCPP
jgi:hypothetical protein